MALRNSHPARMLGPAHAGGGYGGQPGGVQDGSILWGMVTVPVPLGLRDVGMALVPWPGGQRLSRLGRGGRNLQLDRRVR